MNVCSSERARDSGYDACPLAFLLGVKAVLVAVAASVPELRAGVGLLVVVPADVVVPTRALVQNQGATGVQRGELFRQGGSGHRNILHRSHICRRGIRR